MQLMFLSFDLITSQSYHQSTFLTVGVIEVDVLVLGVIELNVFGATFLKVGLDC
jgi:hypothetical protein